MLFANEICNVPPAFSLLSNNSFHRSAFSRSLNALLDPTPEVRGDDDDWRSRKTGEEVCVALLPIDVEGEAAAGDEEFDRFGSGGGRCC
jgi:hypothetical protein